MNNKNILVVDDEPLIRKLVTDFLKKSGYTTIEAEDGRKALELFSEEDIDLIILDVMLPEYDGWTVCREIRKKSKVPIIMLTARGEEFDELFGFDIGADEYIAKPFSPNILIARVNAVLRRAVTVADTNLKEFNGLTIDQSARQVVIEGTTIELSPKEYELLNYLVENYGKALSREQILDKVWGYDYYGDLRTVDTHINRLRIKLNLKSNYVQTVRGYGYRFEVEK